MVTFLVLTSLLPSHSPILHFSFAQKCHQVSLGGGGVTPNSLKIKPENILSVPESEQEMKRSRSLFFPEFTGTSLDCQGERHGTDRIPESRPG